MIDKYIMPIELVSSIIQQTIPLSTEILKKIHKLIVPTGADTTITHQAATLCQAKYSKRVKINVNRMY